MVTLRFALPAVLAAAVAAGCFSYFAVPPARVESGVRLPPAVLYSTGPDPQASDRPPTPDERAAAAFEKAAEEILRRAPNTRASAGSEELPITGPIPLPRRRPIAR